MHTLLDQEDRATADPPPEDAEPTHGEGRTRNQLSDAEKFRLASWLHEHRAEQLEESYAASAHDAAAELGFVVTAANILGARKVLGWPTLKTLRERAAEEAEPETLEERLERKIDELDGKILAVLKRLGVLGERLEQLETKGNSDA